MQSKPLPASQVLPCLALLLAGCSLLLPASAPTTEPDADGGEDSDVGPDGDADADEVADGEGDAEEDGDGDADEDADVEPGTIADLTVPDGLPETVTAGTSIVVTPVVSWDGPQVGGVPVLISASGGGLVSSEDWPGFQPHATFETNSSGGLERFRVTFPLGPTPYAVQLGWRLTWGAEPVDLGGPITVSAAHMVSVPIVDGPGDAIQLPEGLAAAQVAELDACTNENFEDLWNRPTAIAVTSGAYGHFVVVSCCTEAWFLPSRGGAVLHRTAPAAPDGDGPDRLSRIAFAPAGLVGASEPGLFAVGAGTDAGGGLYGISADGTVTLLQSGVHAYGIDSVPGYAGWPAGVYWARDGRIRRTDIEHTPFATVEIFDWPVWPISLAVGDPDVYGSHSLFALTCQGMSCDPVYLERVDSHGDHTFVENLGTINPEEHELMASRGHVFGNLVYRVERARIRALVPYGSAHDVSHEDVAVPGWSASLAGATIQPFGAEAAGAPPFLYGMYVLDALPDRRARIIRIFQNLGP